MHIIFKLSPKNNSPSISVSFLSALRRTSVVFVPAIFLLAQSMASLQRKHMKGVLPLISKGTWFDSRSSSWPSQKKSKGWNTQSRSFYGNSGLYSECTQVQRFTGNFQRFSQMIEIKSTVSQPVWSLCLKLKIMRISFVQDWSQQVHQAFEVKRIERQSLMSLEL